MKTTEIFCLAEVETMPQRIFVRLSFSGPKLMPLTAGAIMVQPEVWQVLQRLLGQLGRLSIETIDPLKVETTERSEGRRSSLKEAKTNGTSNNDTARQLLSLAGDSSPQ